MEAKAKQLSKDARKLHKKNELKGVGDPVDERRAAHDVKPQGCKDGAGRVGRGGVHAKHGPRGQAALLGKDGQPAANPGAMRPP